jgi:formiminoglutamase
LLIQLYYGKKYFLWKSCCLYKHDLAKITNHRSGEIKFGEKNAYCPKDTDQSSTCEAQYVVRPKTLALEQILVEGAASAWDSAKASLIFNTIDFVKEVRSSFLDINVTE